MDELWEVRTKRLFLRRPVEADWEGYRLLDGDPRVMATLGGLRSEEQTQRYVADQVAIWSRDGFGWWTALDGDSGAFVGRGGLRRIRLDGVDEVEVGYALVPGCWGRGLATELATTAVGIGRTTLGLRRIVGIALPTNRASRRVLEKAGLTYRRETDHKGLRHVLYAWDDASGAPNEAR